MEAQNRTAVPPGVMTLQRITKSLLGERLLLENCSGSESPSRIFSLPSTPELDTDLRKAAIRSEGCMYAKNRLKGSETCMKQIHLYKKKIGDYNIVLYPKTGKIHFQNVCLLKCPFWISRKKNLETYRESQVSF